MTFSMITYDHQMLLEIRDQCGIFYVSTSFDSKSAFQPEIFRHTDKLTFITVIATSPGNGQNTEGEEGGSGTD